LHPTSTTQLLSVAIRHLLNLILEPVLDQSYIWFRFSGNATVCKIIMSINRIAQVLYAEIPENIVAFLASGRKDMR